MRQAVFVFAALGGLASTVTAATVNVGPGQSIQSAINGASDGDEIIVAPGTYHEAIDFAGKAITLRSSAGPDVTMIDASGLASSVVTCENGERTDTVLDGFTITGGEGNELLSKRVGGGMMNSLTDPTVMNCIFVQNTADEGGGMWNRGRDPMIINCMFIENTAGEMGELGLGGGGMYNLVSDPTLINCVFSGNVAERYGGGIHLQVGTLTLVNCEFQGNTATSGGAIYTTEATLSLVNSTISNNNATSWGGGAALLGTTATVSNCILWNNAPEQIVDVGGIATLNHCDIMGGWSGPGTSNSDTDPMFVDPTSGDYRLGEGSPCIDAGDNAAVPADIDTDLDGNPRVVAMVDLGPYESQVETADPCPWDGDGDGTVGFADLATLLSAWGSIAGSASDFDGDGMVALTDLTTLLASWGPCS